MRMMTKPKNNENKESIRFFINSLDGVDLHRANLILKKDIQNISELNNLNKFTLILFFLVCDRISDSIYKHKKLMLKELRFINITKLNDELNSLTERRQSLIITYFQNACSSLKKIDYFTDREYNDIISLFDQVMELDIFK